MADVFIAFLGRNTENILADARKAFPEMGEATVIVISRDGDKMVPPPGVQVVEVGAFMPNDVDTYTVIANGGTTAQLLPVIKRLVKVGADFDAWDLQRDAAPFLVW